MSDHVTVLDQLRAEPFIRERIRPTPGDFYYLHLSDLLMALAPHATEEPIELLDFGCGGSPYRSLFPNARYRRADVRGAASIDFEISDANTIDAPDESFDFILSTQVLEHCRDPRAYLNECGRLLRKSGTLLLSTHGLFEDHACPLDFHRWTSDGLDELLTSCNLVASSITRVTMGPRAGFQLLQSSIAHAADRQRPPLVRALLWPIFRLLLARRIWDRLLDSLLPEYRVSTSRRVSGDNFYLVLLAVAGRRP